MPRSPSAAPPLALAIGIDLGTTHTVLAHAPASGGAPQPWSVPQLVGADLEGREPRLPSFLYAVPPGEPAPDPRRTDAWLVGLHARRRGAEVAGRSVSSFKSWLSHGAVDRTAAILPWGAHDEATPRLSPVDASARVLAHLVRAWDAEHPDAPLARQLVVLTVPASFDPVARELTLEAATRAGLTVRLLEEPQAAFHAWMAVHGDTGLTRLLGERDAATVLVVDVGGGTSDFTLLVVRRAPALSVERVAVGRHLLLGGDNMDLALAHHVEPALLGPAGAHPADGRAAPAPERLEPRQFAQLVQLCRGAKERLLSADPPAEVRLALGAGGAALVGSARAATLTAEATRALVLEGFLPLVERDAAPARGRGGLVGFGLPYEADPAITRHLAAFLSRNREPADPSTPGPGAVHAVLLNGGVFHAPALRERLLTALERWGGVRPEVLEGTDPDQAVALGAVAFGQVLATGGRRIGGGSPRAYLIGLGVGAAREGQGAPAGGPASGVERAVCVVPRGAREGERHVAASRRLALAVGRPARFDAFASEDARLTPGAVVPVSGELAPLPEVTAVFDAVPGEREVLVVLEGEISAAGTLQLACVEVDPRPGEDAPRHHRLTFEVRGDAPPPSRGPASVFPRSGPVSVGPRSLGPRVDEARAAVERVFGKGRKDVPERAVKDLWRDLEKLLGERATWNLATCRALTDALLPLAAGRKRSPDHERVFLMLAGYSLRPGFGHALDPRRAAELGPLLIEGAAFAQEARCWEQLFIAARRVAGGLSEDTALRLRDLGDPFLAPAEDKLKKPKGWRPLALTELREALSALERVPAERRAQLGRWLLDQTWRDRDPRLWTAIARIGARVPAYASAHHVVPPRTVERWVDHLLRERWEEVPTAPRAALELCRATGDRARDLPEAVRTEVARRLVAVGAPAPWAAAVREPLPVEEQDRSAWFGEGLPPGLRLVEAP